MSWKSRVLLPTLAALSLLTFAWTALGADPSAAKKTDPDVVKGPAKAASDTTDSPADKSLREQDIYIPYDKLRQVFEKHGRGVFLPYEKFEQLWQAAEAKSRPDVKPQPPVDAVITEIDNEATVAKDVVRVKAAVKIDLLAEGWLRVPLRLSDAAIASATLAGQPARILAGGGDCQLLVEKKGKQPESIVLQLEYAKAISKMPGQNSVSFEAPQAPVNRWRVRIPQAGAKVNLHPLIAATEVPPEKREKGAPGEAKPAAEETVVLAFVGPAPSVRIDWTPKAEGAAGLAALVSAQAEQQVSIDEAGVRSRVNMTYSISRAELGQMSLEAPADYKVVNVFDANVRQWSVEPPAAGGKQQKIVIQLFEPAKQQQQVCIELEKFAAPAAQARLVTPVVKALGVGRQEGIVVVQAAPGLRAETARTTGLLQIDAAELPPALRRQPWTFAYRYAAVPYELALSVEQLRPRITAESLVQANLQPERLTLDVTTAYADIERAGVFKLEFDVPPGYDVRRVRGCEIGAPGGAAAQVDSHHVEGEKKNRLVVNLSRKAIGRVGLCFQLQKDLQEPKLLAPSGQAADIPLPVPQVAADTVERASGKVVVYAPDSLRVNPGKTDGLRSISFGEAASGFAAPPPADSRPALAFAFAQEPINLRLAAVRKKPEVTIRQLLAARVEQGVVKYQATFSYTILYSGVKSLRIDVPAEAVGVRNVTPAVRDKVIDPPPADLTKGSAAWSFTGQSELIGNGKIELVWEKKLDHLEVGKSVEISVPRLIPEGADRAWGQIVLAKAETLDVQPAGEPKGLRPIDPQRDLMAAVAGAAAAFEFQGDWALTAAVTRYQLEDIKRTSIDRAVVRMVVTRADMISVQAVYRVQSARQRLTVRLPDDPQFDVDPLRLNGRSVALERGQKGEYFVPLLNANPDEPFLLEIRYTVKGDGSRLDLPAFVEDAAVQQVYLCVYLPADQALLGATGPWTAENRDAPRPAMSQFWPGGGDYGNALVAWVREGTKAGEVGQFPTEGTLHVYSALRPAPPPDGSLHIVSWNETGLSVIVFLVAVALGVIVLPAKMGRRALAVGAVVILLVLAGVFCPTFSKQIFNNVLALAVLVVLVLWIAVYAALRLPAQAARWRAAAATSSAGPPSPSEAKAGAVDRLMEAIAAEPPPAEPPAEPPKPEGEGGQTHA